MSSATRRIPESTRQSFLLQSRSYDDWLSDTAGREDDREDEYHLDPLQLLLRAEDDTNDDTNERRS